MYTLPISDTKAISVDDADENAWQVHVVDIEAQAIESFSVEGVGHVQSAHFDTARGLLWITVDRHVFAIQLSSREIFDVPMADEKDEFVIYSMIGDGPYVYVSGEYSNLWRIALPALEWEPLLRPEAAPERSDDAEEQTRRNQEYAAKYPPFYSGFRVGDDHVFCGALGALARIRDGVVETKPRSRRDPACPAITTIRGVPSPLPRRARRAERAVRRDPRTARSPRAPPHFRNPYAQSTQVLGNEGA